MTWTGYTRKQREQRSVIGKKEKGETYNKKETKRTERRVTGKSHLAVSVSGETDNCFLVLHVYCYSPYL